jgi:branched-chain amino acid transport system permease protein
MLSSLLVYGLINSVTLALTALGFSLTYGISRVANFAHGALYVIAGFSAWALLNRFHLNYFAATFLAVIITALLGAAIYRLALMRVRGMPLLEIIVTFALGTAALEALRFFGFLGSNFSLPPLLPGSVTLLGVPVDMQRIAVVAVGGALVLMLWLLTHHTRIGLAFRAMAQDEQAAMMSGIDSDLMATLSLALGAALVAVAAVVLLPLSFIGDRRLYSWRTREYGRSARREPAHRLCADRHGDVSRTALSNDSRSVCHSDDSDSETFGPIREAQGT